MMESVTLILAAFLTSTLSAVIGMGGGVTLLAIMAMVMPDGYLVVAYHGIIQLVSNVTRTTVYQNEINLPLLARFSKGIIPGLFAAAGIVYGLIQYFDVSSASELKIDFLKPLIGIYIIWFLYLRKKNPISDKSFLWMGGISGLVTVFVGATGPLIAPFFISRDMKKESVIATKAACQAIGHMGKMPIFIFLFGVNYIKDWSVILPLILAVYIGTKFGKGILGKLPEAIFKKIFRIALTLIAIRLILLNLI
jgi:uncharacterized membrane protein YfcA